MLARSSRRHCGRSTPTQPGRCACMPQRRISRMQEALRTSGYVWSTPTKLAQDPQALPYGAGASKLRPQHFWGIG
jgi:hypothetical protein